METEQNPEWITQTEAAKLSGRSLNAIHQLTTKGRLRIKEIYGKRLVKRQDVLDFKPKQVGRPKRLI